LTVPPAAARAVLTQAFEKASQAAAPAVCLPPALSGLPRRPALVLGTGKAAAAMATAFEAHWGAPVRGMVVTRYGHGLLPGERCDGIEIVNGVSSSTHRRGCAGSAFRPITGRPAIRWS
jgi:hydroxypyruvate reductase